MSIEKKIEEFKDDLELFDDELEKYQFIIDLGKKLSPLDEKEMVEENLVQGCTSKVWLVKDKKNDELIFRADSNAAIVKGLVYIITTIFSNEKKDDINTLDINILDKLNLTEIITPNRQSGVQGMIKKIKEYAKEK
ncbi:MULTISPECIES: SufE family protein [Arcobacter]|uniref:Fe-S metabolism associated SufE n=1 Tax=Arcobacter nitrofigilis (strain ATCC 33309 / DSM 7299 / CCUG 15893 / LMG 7604 / NCTC 12251 / CI) TaxID=572480 RepID=D5V2V2_ARCNC|nr:MULTISPECIES: SufE family protein [Arcobacter]ADG92534.1 Fe-S metabolism associated SufE [Arcobacter nitrofigilis DSM 7299]RXJ81837.1 Fe-S metabolism associated SufE [Arcobacter sp. F2176]